MSEKLPKGLATITQLAEFDTLLDARAPDRDGSRTAQRRCGECIPPSDRAIGARQLGSRHAYRQGPFSG